MHTAEQVYTDKESSKSIWVIAITTVLLALVYQESLLWMFDRWNVMDEYSHGMIIPFVCGYLIWMRRDKLVHPVNDRNWYGVGWVLLGLCLFGVADLATVYVAVILSFLITLYGFIFTALGWRNTKEIIVPLLMLIFMVPLPSFINNNLSSELQLISSQLGVIFIRLFDIGVYLEGNVIDLGSYKLQVVDACSGLRYLYPLVALGFILVYLCKIPFWQKALIFLSTIPITMIMNSIRIGAIGVSVEYWGAEMAEGLLHDIEGWFMFMASLAVVLVELKLLLMLSKRKESLADIVLLDQPEGKANLPSVSASFVPLCLVFVLTAGVFVLSQSNTKEEEIKPERLSFNHFPLFVGDWHGSPGALENIYIDALKFDDYIMADYQKGSDHLNFYVAYYGSQKKGQSAHSPRSCIPGGGWIIESIEQVNVSNIHLNSQPLIANRTVIRKGDVRQVVYYWFQQRGRILTNEYLVKWYIFWDALNDNRTDGALVRLTVPLEKGEGLEQADLAVADFISNIQFRMNDFIPN